MPRPELYPVKKIVGFDHQMIDAIEKWRGKQRPIPNASEAIRKLVEIGLWSAHRAVLRTKKATDASEMAGQEIDRLGDPSATDEERQLRFTLQPPDRCGVYSVAPGDIGLGLASL